MLTKKKEAVRVAADSVPRSEFAALASSVADLKKKQARPMADLNAFADMQAKADAALRSHNERAEPPMSGEELVNYGIRMHRKMQRHSAKWKGVDLGLISADRQALENIFNEIRADTGDGQHVHGRHAAVSVPHDHQNLARRTPRSRVHR